MPVLTEEQRNSIKFYLGYTNDQIPHGDYAILEKELLRDRPAQHTTAIEYQIQECLRVFQLQALDKQESGIQYRRLITGDTNRTDINYTSEPLRVREKKFIRETDYLARLLGVINYTNPENDGRKYMGTIQP